LDGSTGVGPYGENQMNNQDNLVLRLARLKSPEEVEQKGELLIFLFPKGGAGKCVSRLGTQRLLPGDVFLVNAAVGFKLSPFDPKGEFLFWAFSVCFENLLPLFSAEEISLLHQITESFKMGKAYPASSSLSVECHQLLGLVPAQSNLNHRGHLIRIASAILSVEFGDMLAKRKGNGRSDDHMVRVFEKLSASELISLSVPELADRFSCSRRHLNRLFHQHFGVSVASLRMEMRLLKAISLLRDAGAKVIHVAEECGFNHLGLFNTCFKRRFGTSPGQWRKANLLASADAVGKPGNNLAYPLNFGEARALNCLPIGAVAEAPGASGLDKKNALENLKKNLLLAEAQSLATIKNNPPEARGGA
jgi:AraC-like DNA-binding protein